MSSHGYWLTVCSLCVGPDAALEYSLLLVIRIDPQSFQPNSCIAIIFTVLKVKLLPKCNLGFFLGMHMSQTFV